MHRFVPLLLGGLLLPIAHGATPDETPVTPVAETPAIGAPASEARPQIDGLPNLFRVSPTLWRGAQPTAEGMRNLRTLGVKTVLSLRAFHSDRDELDGTGLRSERIWFKTWHAEDEDVVRFLRLVTDPANQPVFVHCQHGADRTGTMVAVYRIVVQGWSKERAIEELRQGGFGFHEMWSNLVAYLEALDVDALRRQAGIAAPTPTAAEATPAPAPSATEVAP